MAVAKCGMRWTWDSPMYCTGKNEDMCKSCPWFIDNKDNEDEYNYQNTPFRNKY